jgi:hypothetical protein
LLLDGVVEVVGPDVVEGHAEAVAFDLGLLSVGRLIAEDGNDDLHKKNYEIKVEIEVSSSVKKRYKNGRNHRHVVLLVIFVTLGHSNCNEWCGVELLVLT